MRAPESIIKRPLMTEKSNRLKEFGGGPEVELDPEEVAAQVAFEVASDANKIEIRHAVEKLWQVEVKAVRTMMVPGKVKRLGRFTGKRSNWKKALVTLAPGQSIDFFEGV